MLKTWEKPLRAHKVLSRLGLPWLRVATGAESTLTMRQTLLNSWLHGRLDTDKAAEQSTCCSNPSLVLQLCKLHDSF